MGRIVYEPPKPVVYTHLPMRELGNKRPLQDNEVIIYQMDAQEEYEYNRFKEAIHKVVCVFWDTIETIPSLVGAGIATHIGLHEILNNPYVPMEVPVFAPIELSVLEPFMNKVGMWTHYTSGSVLILGCIVITIDVVRQLINILKSHPSCNLDVDSRLNRKIALESMGVLVIYYLLRLI